MVLCAGCIESFTFPKCWISIIPGRERDSESGNGGGTGEGGMIGGG